MYREEHSEAIFNYSVVVSAVKLKKRSLDIAKISPSRIWRAVGAQDKKCEDWHLPILAYLPSVRPSAQPKEWKNVRPTYLQLTPYCRLISLTTDNLVE